MSTLFKQKQPKKRYVTNICKLDESHIKIIENFEKQKRSLPKKKKKLKDFKKKLEALEKKDSKKYTTNDIITKANLKEEIKKLEDTIADIENNVSEIDYYSQVDDILMDYYDIYDNDDKNIYRDNPELSKAKSDNHIKKLDKLDKLNMIRKKKRKYNKITKRRKRPPNNTKNDITIYFKCVDKVKKNQPNRADLLKQYTTFVKNEHSSGNIDNKIIRKCNQCNTDKTLIQSEGIFVCLECGDVDMIIIESETPNYKDHVPDKPGYPYKRELCVCGD